MISGALRLRQRAACNLLQGSTRACQGRLGYALSGKRSRQLAYRERGKMDYWQRYLKLCCTRRRSKLPKAVFLEAGSYSYVYHEVVTRYVGVPLLSNEDE